MSEKSNSVCILYKLIGTTFFTGHVPIAPGTAGTLFCVLVLWFLPVENPLAMSVIAAAIFVSGVKAAGNLEPVWGKDPGKITIDEAAGMTVALIGIPKTAEIWFAAFILFRVFDIFKPPPVRQMEYLPHGWGVMMDDIIAGIYANIVCRVIIWAI